MKYRMIGLFFLLNLFLTVNLFANEKHPIVFAHGAGVPYQLFDNLVPLKEEFKKRGYTLYIAQTPAHESIDVRAKDLFDEIKRLVPEGKFHLLGHSMGGLDARLAIHKYNLGSRCLSLLTIATPHYGSPLADILVDIVDRPGDKTIAEQWLIDRFENEISTFRNLTTDFLQNKFNQEVYNDPRVQYFSMGFYIPDPVFRHTSIPMFWKTDEILDDHGIFLSDGMVPLNSMQWGNVLPDSYGDHYAIIGPIPFGGEIIYQQMILKMVQVFALVDKR